MTNSQSKIERLISELCPNGVESKSIGEICQINRGRVMSKDYLRDNAGEYPVYSSQTVNEGIFGRIATYDYNGEYITWTTDGANAGSIFYRNGKFSITNVCGLLKVKVDNVNVKFLSYILATVSKKYVSAGMGNPKIMSNVMERIKISLPPLAVQEEIVKILNTFTELESELESELEARKKQYEYYRDELFIFDDSVEWKSLGEISEKIYSGGTPKTGEGKHWDGGNIPWMSSGEVNYETIHKTENFITEIGLKNSSAKYVPKNSVVIALAGQGKTRGKVARTRIDLTTNQSLAAITFDDNKISSDYVFHFLKSQYLQLRQVSSGDGTRGGLNLQMISNYKIPVPSLKDQEKIVSILDKFDALVNDISIGLPAELSARRSQYEYYRSKLLTFKEYVR